MWGLDLLGLAKFKKAAIRTFPNNWALGFFDNTFGDALPAAEKIILTGKCPLVRVHLLWSDSHSFGDKDIPKIKKLSRKYQALAKKYPMLKVEISPFCEHNLKNPDKYLSIVEQEAPDCVPVNTPDKGALSKKYKNETHHSSKALAGEYNFSYDGASAVDSDVTKDKQVHKSADVFFFWIPQFNGRKGTNDTTPRSARKAWPDQKLIKSVIYLATQRGNVSLPKRYLVKSHAEQTSVPPDLRACKLLMIIPPKVSRVELLTNKGQTVALSGGPIPYKDGRFRYYFGQYGFELAQKALNLTGDPLVKVRIGDKIAGRINPAFRVGEFR